MNGIRIEKKYPTEEELLERNDPMMVAEPSGTYYLRKSQLYTYADYQTWMDDKRRELINGIVYLMGAPTRFHAGVSAALQSIFYWFIKKRKGECKVYHAPFDVRLPQNGKTADNEIYTVVQPDICVVCDPEKLDDRGCIGAPDLIVEVQSPSTAKRDLNEKFFKYEESGVREYWVVYPKEKALTVFLLQENGKYNAGKTYEYEGKVPVSIFKGLKIDIKELFDY
ncbi:MAG: Uma2 family endonuclease [Dysgonamonadaceae bacterium]|jgi:Uma2 family endonuclease|nr:Uma2 family endonuclease [Dysgonamonadaceae bacterium]